MTEKKKFALSGERIAIVGLLVALTFTLAGFAIASAATTMPAANGIVRFCRLNSNGNARIVTPSTACASTERKVQMRSYDPIAVEFDASSGTVFSSKNIGGHATSITRHAVGSYIVAFDRDVSHCVPTTSVIGFSDRIAVSTVGENADEIRIFTFDLANAASDTAVDLAVTC
jgi:hypothetical protein